MRSFAVLLAAALLLVAATAALAVDTTPPTISSVVVSPAMVASSDTVHVAVIATDNVGVAGVTADSLDLVNTSGNLWEGDVAADPALGLHNVTVVAHDAVDNEVTDASGVYKTVPVMGLRNDQALYSTTALSCGEYVFKVWGRATYRDENTFTLTDGGPISTRVISPGHGVCSDDYVAARGILDSSVSPAKLTGVQYQIIQAAPRKQMTIQDVTVGKDLQVAHLGSLPDPAPLGATLPVTIMSLDPSKVRLAKTLSSAGSASIVVTVPAGTTTIPTFYVHGLASSGTVDVLATAPGCLGKRFGVTLTPSGFGIYYPTSFSTTTLSADTEIQVMSGRLSPTTGVVQSWQRVRGGITVQVPVTSSDEAIGKITTSPIAFANGASSVSTYFDPAASGEAEITVGVPTGFTQPSNNQSITATVTDSNVLSANETVGLDLQTAATVHLEAAPTEPVDVTVTVDNANATITTDPAVEGTSSITFSDVSGTGNQTFYVQGRALGTATMTVGATGYSSNTYTITVDPSGFVIASPSAISTSLYAANTNVQVCPALLYPTTLAYRLPQNVRGGKSVDVTVTSSSPAVGVITISPLSFTGNSGTLTTAFDPVGGGASTVTVDVPSGFSTPSNYRQIQATVSSSEVLSTNSTVGVDLHASNSVHLQTAPAAPVDITVTVADPTKATLSKSATTEGTGSITFSSVNTTGTQPFYVQGRSQGITTFTCSALGYGSKTYTVTVDPSGFYIYSPGSDPAPTTTCSANTAITVRSCRISGSSHSDQSIRGGKTVSLTVASSDPAVGAITISPVTFTANTGSASTAFDPLTAGTSTVALVTPEGFSTPATDQQRLFTVVLPGITNSDKTVGCDLQTSSTVNLQEMPPSPVTVTVTVGDPTKATLSIDPLVTGTGSITFSNVIDKSARSFYVQGRGLGTTTITVSASGYADSTKTITIDPSGFVISSPASINTRVTSSNTNVLIAPARLDPSTLAFMAVQALRGGLTVSDIYVVSSEPTVGTITTSPVSLAPNGSSVTTQFDPLAVGTSVISVTPPAGFSTPLTKRTINATVTQ